MSDDSPERADATLVVGADAEAHERACGHLVDAERSDCLRVTTDEEAARVCAEATARFADGVVFDDMTLAQVGVALSEAVENYDASGEGAPQVCLDGLPHPDSDPEQEALFRFLHAAISRVRSVGGECHVHLDTDTEQPLDTLVEPLFDAVLEAHDATAEDSGTTGDAVGTLRSWADHDGEPTSG